MLTRTQPPAALLSVDDIKAHLNLTRDDQDALLASLEKRAVNYFDGYSGILGRAIMRQTWTQTFPKLSEKMRLDIGNVVSVTSVTYYDTESAEQTLNSSLYYLHSDGIGHYIKRKAVASYPETEERDNAVTVEFLAGWATAADVPEAIQAGVLLLIGHLYNNDSEIGTDQMHDLPFGFHDLVAPFRKHF